MATIKHKSRDLAPTRLQRKRVPIGDRLAAVIGVVAREMLPLEWIKGSNGGTDHIVTEILNYLDQQSVSGRGADPFPFIAFFGNVGYEDLDFPDDSLDAVSTEIKRMMETLEALTPGSEVRGPQPPDIYSLALRGFRDCASAELWIRGEWELQEKFAKLHAATKGLIDSLPANYRERYSGLMKATFVVRQEIASALEAAINEEAKKRPHATYDDKKELAKWVNAELRALGLAVKDSKTGRSCHLVGNPGNRPGVGRFMLNCTETDGTLTHSTTSVELPWLDLMPDDLSRAPYGQRTGKSRGR